MSFSTQRLTCFALISAMEADMRIAMQVAAGDVSPAEVLPPDRVATAQDRRAKAGLRPARTLSGVLDYLDFGHIYEALRSVRNKLHPETDNSLESIRLQVSKLIEIRNRVAHTRPMELDDTSVLLDAAGTILDADRGGWFELDSTIKHLKADPAYVLGLTINLPKDDPRGPQHNLPIPDFDETGFLGRRKELLTIKRRILGAYPVVSILGDGGVGKTAIALKAAYDILGDPACPFEAIVWVTAKATILTPHEIQRVSGAIENSLGLFAAATQELGPGADDPVEELYAYLGTFKILLILDNLETVLDAALRNFLLDLPVGSKVLLTSRIAVGVENPVPLEPLTHDESKALLKALGKSRNVRFIEKLDPASTDKYVDRMAGHPAYIKWFVSGIQAGVRPEDLINNNGLLLDFCMSNVYKHLAADARRALECMQVLPGPRNQAELAYLGEFNARGIQSALLALLTTNFISMTHSSDENFHTFYHLSDFAQQYLDKHHPVNPSRRAQIVARGEQLRAWGVLITEEVAKTPFSPLVVNIRSKGDVGVARLLREAIAKSESDFEEALGHCKDAQALAPGYYEPWRVEGFIRTRASDVDAAATAYLRALELAPESTVLAYHYGDFLLNNASDPRRALGYLQNAARADPNSYEILGQIAWAHYLLGDFRDAILSAGSAAAQRGGLSSEAAAALSVIGRAAARALAAAKDDFNEAIEALENAIDVLDSHDAKLLCGEVGDWFILVADEADALAQRAEARSMEPGSPYASVKGRQYAAELRMRVRGATGSNRQIGSVSNIHRENGYAFLLPGHHFLHVRECVVRSDWDRLQDGDLCVFTEAPANDKGRRAQRVRLMAW